MIYNTRNRCNDTSESQKGKNTRFNGHFQYSESKITQLKYYINLNTVCVNMEFFNQNFLNYLTLYENHLSQSLCSRHCLLIFCGTANLALFLACS